MQITINGETFKLLSYECSLNLIEIGDRTETMDGTTHIENRKIKRHISATTADLLREDAYRLMQALNNAYLTVTYQDTMLNTEDTRIFILNNNPQFAMKHWKNGREYYSGIALELIEKRAE